MNTYLDSATINKIKKHISQEYTLYIVLVIFTSILVTIVLKLWEKDLRIPFSYMIDALGPLKEVKNATLGNGLYDMPQVAAPLGSDETRAIKGFIIHHVFLRALALITKSAPLSINLYYLASYPLTAAFSFYSMRKIGLNKISAFVLSILYTFLPYHLYKSTYHLYLSCYYLIPLTCLVIFGVANGNYSTESKWINKNTIFMAVISLMIGLSDTYYAAFYCIILVFAALQGSIRKRNCKSILLGAIFCTITLLSALGAILPAIRTSFLRGGNVYSGLRGIYDVELYSLKLAQLLLPIHGHRIKWLNDIRVNYEAASIPAHEGAYAALGIIMGLGFVLAIANLFLFNRKISHKMICVSRIILFIFLLTTVGGINSFIGLFVTASIRTYARIVVFLAFFAACFVGLSFDIFMKNKVLTIRCGFSVIILGIGLLDQISPMFSQLGYYEVFTNGVYFPYNEIAEAYQDDEMFVREIEAIMPDQAMILELPIVYDTVGDRFPNGATGAIGLQRPYLHSHSTRWSCASQRGDDNDKWLGKLSRFSYEEMLDIAVIAGFQGIYIDTKGYTEAELLALIGVIEQKTKATAICDKKGELRFYSLVEYAETVKNLFSEEELMSYREAVLTLHLTENERLYYPETSGICYTENCSINNGKLTIPSGELQFGPYQELKSGVYEVFVSGNNLTDAEVSVYSENSDDTIFFSSYSFQQDDNSISYHFELLEDTPNLEFTLKNIGAGNCVMNHVFLVKKDYGDDDSYIMSRIHKLLVRIQCELP